MTHTTDPLLAIDRSLTADERVTFDAYVDSHWKRLVGAPPADVLEHTTDYDMFLDWTEPFYVKHEGAPVLELPAVTPALHALIILGRELTPANVIKVLTAAGLMPQHEAVPPLPWTSVTVAPVRAVIGWSAAGQNLIYFTGAKVGASGAFLVRYHRIPAAHPPIWDMAAACQTYASVTSADEGRRLADRFEAGEDIPEIGWFHGRPPEGMRTT